MTAAFAVAAPRAALRRDAAAERAAAPRRRDRHRGARRRAAARGRAGAQHGRQLASAFDAAYWWSLGIALLVADPVRGAAASRGPAPGPRPRAATAEASARAAGSARDGRPAMQRGSPACTGATPGRRACAARAGEPSCPSCALAFRHVFRAVNRLRGRDTHLGGAELSHAQFELLIELDERGELPAGELALAAAADARERHADARRRSRECGPRRARPLGERPARRRLAPDAARPARDRGQAQGVGRALGARARRMSPRPTCARPSACSSGSPRCSRSRRPSSPAERPGEPPAGSRKTALRCETLCYSRDASRAEAVHERAPAESAPDDGDLEQIATRTGPHTTSSARGPEGPIFFARRAPTQRPPRDPSDATQVHTPEHPQHRDHGPHRRRQDDDDRAHPLLHRPHLQDRRGPRGRRGDGLDGTGAGARHHDHLRCDDRAVEGPPHQHHRHAGPRRLHGRGRALAARARRRDRAVRLGRRRRAAVRDGLAPGRQVPRAAHRLHQQDGPHRRGLRPGRADDDRPPRRAPRADPAADRRRGRLRGDRRPRGDEGGRLQGRDGQGTGRHRDPRAPRRGGRAGARAPARGGLPLRRRAARADPRGGRDPRGRAQAGDPQGDALDEADPRPVRLLVQEQGRAAAARRGHRLPALAARRAAGDGHRTDQGRGAGARGACARPTTPSPSRRSPSRSPPTPTSASSPTSASTPAGSRPARACSTSAAAAPSGSGAS